MVDIVKWIVAHWEVILQVVGGLVAVASVITAVTPTPVDDGVVRWIRDLLGRLSALTHKDAPGTVSLPLVQKGDEPLMFERTRR